MQGKLLAAALFASLPLAASAQSSVVIYGIADASFGREDTGAQGGRTSILASGNQSTSRIGFKGTEDIGNGLKALFALEAGLAIDTGAGDSVLFGRRSVVGLQGSFGTITLGREYTPIADVAAASDALGQGFYGTNLSSFATGKLTRRISNSMNYRSNSMSGLKFGASYGLGETATGPSQNLMGFSADYTIGGLYLGAGYHTYERLSSGDDKEMILGAGYKFGAFEIKGNYMMANPTGASNKYEQFNIGATYTFGANKLFTNLTRNELETGAESNGLSIAYTYTLSKRTNVYAVGATTRNNALGVFGLTSAGRSFAPPTNRPGSDPTAFALGLRHMF